MSSQTAPLEIALEPSLEQTADGMVSSVARDVCAKSFLKEAESPKLHE